MASRPATMAPHELLQQDIINKIKRLYTNTLSTKYTDNLSLKDEDIVWGLEVLKQMPNIDITSENIKVGSNGANRDGTIRILELRFQNTHTYEIVKNVGFPLQDGSRAQLFPKFVPERYQRREYTVRLSGVPLGAAKDEVLRLVQTQFEGQKFEVSKVENIPLVWGTATVPTNRWAAHIKMFKPGAPLHFDIQNMRFNKTFFPERMVHFAVRALQKRVLPREEEPVKDITTTTSATTPDPNPGQTSQGTGEEDQDVTPDPQDEEDDEFLDCTDEEEGNQGTNQPKDDTPPTSQPDQGGELVPAVQVIPVQDDQGNNNTTREGALKSEELTSPLSVPAETAKLTYAAAAKTTTPQNKGEDGPPEIKAKPTPLVRKRPKAHHSEDETATKAAKPSIMTPRCEEAVNDFLKGKPTTFKFGHITFETDQIRNHVERMEACTDLEIKEGKDCKHKMVIHLLATKGEGRQRSMIADQTSLTRYNKMAAAVLRYYCGGRRRIQKSPVSYHEDIDSQIKHLWLGEYSDTPGESPATRKLVSEYIDEYNQFALYIRGEEDAECSLRYHTNRGAQQHT